MAPIRPVWMLHDSVMADRIGPDQYEVCELIGIGRMCRLWLPRQSPATTGAVAHGEGGSPGAQQPPRAEARGDGSFLPPDEDPFLVLVLLNYSTAETCPNWSFAPLSPQG